MTKPNDWVALSVRRSVRERVNNLADRLNLHRRSSVELSQSAVIELLMNRMPELTSDEIDKFKPVESKPMGAPREDKGCDPDYLRKQFVNDKASFDSLDE